MNEKLPTPDTLRAMLKVALEELVQLNAQHDIAKLDLERYVAEVTPDEVKQKIAEVHAEFDPILDAASTKIAQLEESIKEYTVALGESVAIDELRVEYVRPRVSWDSKMLDGMVALVPQLEKARHAGAPSARIVFKK